MAGALFVVFLGLRGLRHLGEEVLGGRDQLFGFLLVELRAVRESYYEIGSQIAHLPPVR